MTKRGLNFEYAIFGEYLEGSEIKRAFYSGMVYTTEKRARNGLNIYLEKEWQRMKKIFKLEPKYEIVDREQKSVIETGFCKDLVKEEQ